MGSFIVLLIIVAVILYANNKPSDASVSNGGPNVSISGVVSYPDEIICDKCKERVLPNRKTIETSTLDLVCPCGNVAYLHPKRDERRQQIEDMLDW